MMFSCMHATVAYNIACLCPVVYITSKCTPQLMGGADLRLSAVEFVLKC